MDLLASGFGALEIGERLSLTEKTVRNNLSNIYAKLRARGNTDAILMWLGATPRATGC
jgi:DNA-binding NarL/FixJ family response regulator